MELKAFKFWQENLQRLEWYRFVEHYSKEAIHFLQSGHLMNFTTLALHCKPWNKQDTFVFRIL